MSMSPIFSVGRVRLCQEVWNLEVASEYARRENKAFAVLLIGPDGSQPPSDTTLKAGWRHLTQAAQDDLLQHFLGATTWRAVCDACGLDYDALPITIEDAARPMAILRTSPLTEPRAADPLGSEFDSGR